MKPSAVLGNVFKAAAALGKELAADCWPVNYELQIEHVNILYKKCWALI